MDSRPGQGANRSDSLCYREDLQRRHGCEDAVSNASYLRDRTLDALRIKKAMRKAPHDRWGSWGLPPAGLRCRHAAKLALFSPFSLLEKL
jgi:hypothetical protein